MARRCVQASEACSDGVGACSAEERGLASCACRHLAPLNISGKSDDSARTTESTPSEGGNTGIDVQQCSVNNISSKSNDGTRSTYGGAATERGFVDNNAKHLDVSIYSSISDGSSKLSSQDNCPHERGSVPIDAKHLQVSNCSSKSGDSARSGQTDNHSSRGRCQALEHFRRIGLPPGTNLPPDVTGTPGDHCSVANGSSSGFSSSSEGTQVSSLAHSFTFGDQQSCGILVGYTESSPTSRTTCSLAYQHHRQLPTGSQEAELELQQYPNHLVEDSERIFTVRLSSASAGPLEDVRSSSTKLPKVSRTRTQTWCIFFLFVILCVVIAGVVAWTHTLLTTGGPVEEWFKSTARLTLRINETYQANLADNTTAEFQDQQSRVCYNVEESLKEIIDPINCTVQFSSGSVIADIVIEYIATKNITAGELQTYLSAKRTTDYTLIGFLKVFSASILVHNITTEVSSSELRPRVKNCSQTDTPYAPVTYTYHSCGEYLACVNGTWELSVCPEGQEFAYVTRCDTAACDAPSETTYCGKKRLEETSTLSTTPSADSTSDRPTFVLTTQSTKQSTVQATTAVTPSSTEETTTLLPCSAIGPLDSLGSCPNTGVKYIPGNETYPGHCDAFVWCWDGRAFNVMCPPGTHFTMNENGPCSEKAGSPNTFCAMKRRCQ